MSKVLLLLNYKRQTQLSLRFRLIWQFTPKMGKFSTLSFVPVSWARQFGQWLFCGLLSGGDGGSGGHPDNYGQVRVEGVVWVWPSVWSHRQHREILAQDLGLRRAGTP